MRTIISFFLFITLTALHVQSQNLLDENGRYIQESENRQKSSFKTAADSIDEKTVPIGYYMWKIDHRFGDIIPAETDTVPHLFPNTHFTEGIKGEYNTLGNTGSPRLSRIYMRRERRGDFIFKNPYDFFLTEPDELFYTNTKSPYTNITYHESGDKTNGEDRIRAYFASNVNKRFGIGFKLDYLYGRGYYESQSTADFNGTLFGSYIGNKYISHLYFSANHLKTAENGGIEDDRYITNPESFPQKYSERDMPTNLTRVWNKMYVNTFYYTHRYNLGFERYRDKDGNIVKKEKNPAKETENKTQPSDSTGVTVPANDSVKTAIRQLVAQQQADDSDTNTYTVEFVPVTSFIHTLRFDSNTRTFIDNSQQKSFFSNQYITGDSAYDRTTHYSIANTVAIELHEGFNRWAKAGVRLYATHEFQHFSIPRTRISYERFTQNDFTVGAQLLKKKGTWFHYDVFGQLTTTGDDWGEFLVKGKGDLSIPLKKDTLQLAASGEIRNEAPSFYFKHYQSHYTWWDNSNSLDKEFRTRLEGTLSYTRTRTKLHVGIENTKNYTYFAETQYPYDNNGTIHYSHNVEVRQQSKNIQILTAGLNQDFRWGILNWENDLTYQTTTDKEVLPLPALSLYSNLYLKFRIAKVLAVEFGGDVRYFSEYYAPTYAPSIGQFATQAAENRVKIGNYPIVNVYANFRLKSCRFYIMGSHVNQSSSGGRSFLAPHYPINPLLIKFGLSWNFYN